MPSEHAPSQTQGAGLGGHHRSTSSIQSLQTDSPTASPPQHKQKSSKHVVGTGRTHTRVPSSKGLHKKAQGNEGSHTDLKKLNRNSSTTSLKNNSHVTLKRNRSLADVPKRPKSSHAQNKRPASVHFEIGDQEPGDDAEGWEEASSSASPALSRTAISSGQSSAKQSANNSVPQSPIQQTSPLRNREPSTVGEGNVNERHGSHAADGKIITERLLQRVPSTRTTQMSLTTATPGRSPSSSGGKSQGSSGNQEFVSRFVSGSGTPGESSPFLNTNGTADGGQELKHEEFKRTRSMGNLTRHQDSDNEDAQSALAPRSRKSSTSQGYTPSQSSRTQQKLWLQRASSHIEPQQMTTGVAINGLSSIHGGLGTSLVGAGYDGRDPRIKLQLERTGLEYLVVRRHQDPVGKALKRLDQLPGAEKNRRIPPTQQNGKKGEGAGAGRYGLSQSLKESRNKSKDKGATTNGGRSSFEGVGSQDENGINGRGEEDEGVGALLRSIWEKSFDLSASAD